MENKNVGTKLGNAMDNEKPSTSIKPSTSTKSKLKSGKILLSYISEINIG